MRIRLMLGFALTAITLTAAACGSSDSSKETNSASPAAATPAPAAAAAATPAPAAAAEPTAITVKGGDYFYEPKDLTAKPGKIIITMNNSGPERPHTLDVRKKDGTDLGSVPRTNVGATGTVELTITEEGVYDILCTLPGHADRGQRGTLTVKRG